LSSINLLWDEATYHALLNEARRRIEGKRNYRARYPFTGLPVCGICNGKIKRHGKFTFKYLSCDTTHHWSMRYEQAVELFTSALVQQLQDYQDNPPPPVDLAPLKAGLQESQARRTRVQAGYESGLYTAQEASKKLTDIEEEAESLLRKIEQAENYERTKSDWRERMGGLRGMIEKLPHHIQHGDPIRINQLLTALIDRIVLTKDTIQFVWRE
jgi:hypothetical protein